MSRPIDISTTSATSALPERLYPAGIAFLIEERPLLWYEDPRQCDELLRDVFAELAPRGSLECILAKNLVDYIWELRRMKRLKHTAINFAMLDVAGKILAPGYTFYNPQERERATELAADVAYGAAEELKEGEPSLRERMISMRVTPEMIHYRAHNDAAERLHAITRECEQLESRFHRLLKDFEARRATLTAMAKSLLEPERAEAVEYNEVN